MPVTLADASVMEVRQLRALSPAELLHLRAEAARDADRAALALQWVDHVIASKYETRAADARKALGVVSGTVRLQDEDVTVICTAPKRVEWDQGQLDAIVTALAARGGTPADYVTGTYRVSEADYTSWPQAIREIFEPARVVKTGKQTFKLTRAEKGGASWD